MDQKTASSLRRLARAGVIVFAAGLLIAPLTPHSGIGGSQARAETTVEDFQKQLQAARRGDPDALYFIGHAYETGIIVDRDYQQAASWYLEAAKRGNAEAQFRLAKIFHAGARGVTRQPETAVKLYKAAAQRGHPGAQNWLGYAYQHGHGVVLDHSAAVEWYRNAAEQGLPIAQNNLGLMYLRGQGVEQDQAQAAEWFQKAADGGHPLGMNNLAGLYEVGWGVQRDTDQARELYRQAALQGNDLAIENMRRLAVPVPPEAVRQSRINRREREGARNDNAFATDGLNTTGDLQGGELREGEVLGRNSNTGLGDISDAEGWEGLVRDDDRDDGFPSFDNDWFNNDDDDLFEPRRERRRRNTGDVQHVPNDFLR